MAEQQQQERQEQRQQEQRQPQVQQQAQGQQAQGQQAQGQERRQQERTQMAPARRREGLSRADQWRDPWTSPFGLMRRLSDEMDRIFGDWGFGGLYGGGLQELQAWSPASEVFQRGDELVIRADLPGLSREDVNVEVTDDAVTISGERRHEEEEDREGYYRSERYYGAFTRVIPLPEGAIAENAKATFKDGVLEITMPAPPKETRRSRKIEVAG
jgi:HSP20 family protein